MRTTVNPKVTLVGAGPGDPELMTLKGILALNTADVVGLAVFVSKSDLTWLQLNIYTSSY